MWTWYDKCSFPFFVVLAQCYMLFVEIYTTAHLLRYDSGEKKNTLQNWPLYENVKANTLTYQNCVLNYQTTIFIMSIKFQ